MRVTKQQQLSPTTQKQQVRRTKEVEAKKEAALAQKKLESRTKPIRKRVDKAEMSRMAQSQMSIRKKDKIQVCC